MNDKSIVDDKITANIAALKNGKAPVSVTYMQNLSEITRGCCWIHDWNADYHERLGAASVPNHMKSEMCSSLTTHPWWNPQYV